MLKIVKLIVGVFLRDLSKAIVGVESVWGI